MHIWFPCNLISLPQLFSIIENYLKNNAFTANSPLVFPRYLSFFIIKCKYNFKQGNIIFSITAAFHKNNKKKRKEKRQSSAIQVHYQQDVFNKHTFQECMLLQIFCRTSILFFPICLFVVADILQLILLNRKIYEHFHCEITYFYCESHLFYPFLITGQEEIHYTQDSYWKMKVLKFLSFKRYFVYSTFFFHFLKRKKNEKK